MEKEDLNRILENLYFQYQPIVNIKSGEIYGYEALIRGFDTLGFKNPHQLFDYAYKNGFIFHLDIKLREKAIYEFSENFKMGQRLFFNLDSRIILSKDHKNGETLKILENLKIPSKMMVFEVSERFSLSEELIQRVFLYYKEQGFEIALDDFGVGSVCLEAIYKLSPDYLKIDGFFIEDFNKDFIKKEIVYSLSELCRKLNIKVIAEKIETKEDIYMLEEVKISLGQGYYIKKPSQLDKQEKLQLNVQLKRSKSEDVSYIKKYIKESITLYMDDSATTLMEILNKNGKDLKPIIILDKKGHPLSVISFKKMASILNNSIYMNLYFSRKDKLVSDLKDLFEPVTTIEITTNLDIKLMEHLIENSHKDYFVITENLKYVGVIHYKDLIKIVLKEKLLEAIDKNPLTKLPGNISIKKYISNFIESGESFYVAYFDFNNFKPFNDYYGFRRGDRAILMFSEIIKSVFNSENFFIGHIGGDDFFVGAKNIDFIDFYKKVFNVIKKFNHDVISLYDKEDRERGFIVSKDRKGNIKEFKFLSVSGAIVQIPGGEINSNFLDEYIALAKKNAKQKENYIESLCILTSKVKEEVWTL